VGLWYFVIQSNNSLEKNMTTKKVADVTQYNVYCRACGAIFQPELRSPNWWRAKKRADQGYLDAVEISAEQHGCWEAKRPRRDPDAPFRVLGFNCLCEDFDIPFGTFVSAIKEFKDRRNFGLDTVFITGVSDVVKDRIGW
jgi:hypothetical protein